MNYEPGTRHTWSEFFAIGLTVLWHDFKASVAESWREAGAETYGDGCTHPESGLSQDLLSCVVTCGRCGAKRGEDPAMQWWSAADWEKPKRWVEVVHPSGRVTYRCELIL